MTSPSDGPTGSPCPSLWTPGFTRFFLAQCLSWTGSSMTPVALAFGVLHATGSAEALGIVLAASTLPMLVFLLVGGVIADRVPRRSLLVATHLVAGAAQVGTALWFLLGASSLPLLVALVALGGVASALTGPALRGLVTDLVPAAALGRANAARATSRNVLRVLGPTAAGILVATTSAGWALALDALLLIIAAAVLSRIPDPPAAPGGARPTVRSALADLREGWSEVLSHRWLWQISGAFFVVNLLIGGIWLVLAPAQAEAGIGALGWGIILGARAGGQVLGGILAYRWTPPRPLLGVLLLPLPYAAVFAALAADAGLLLLVPLAAIAGVGSAIGDITWETVLQQRVARDRISRVASIDMLLSFASVPVGQLAAPLVAGVVGVPATLAAGSVVLVLALVTPVLSRELRGHLTPAPTRTSPRTPGCLP